MIETDIQVGSTVTSSPRVPRFKSQPGDRFLQKTLHKPGDCNVKLLCRRYPIPPTKNHRAYSLVCTLTDLLNLSIKIQDFSKLDDPSPTP